MLDKSEIKKEVSKFKVAAVDNPAKLFKLIFQDTRGSKTSRALFEFT